jgi:hypothetical protein
MLSSPPPPVRALQRRRRWGWVLLLLLVAAGTAGLIHLYGVDAFLPAGTLRVPAHVLGVLAAVAAGALAWSGLRAEARAHWAARRRWRAVGTALALPFAVLALWLNVGWFFGGPLSYALHHTVQRQPHICIARVQGVSLGGSWGCTSEVRLVGYSLFWKQELCRVPSALATALAGGDSLLLQGTRSSYGFVVSSYAPPAPQDLQTPPCAFD